MAQLITLYLKNTSGFSWIFQQGKSSNHSANVAYVWFMVNEVGRRHLIYWSSVSKLKQ